RLAIQLTGPTLGDEPRCSSNPAVLVTRVWPGATDGLTVPCVAAHLRLVTPGSVEVQVVRKLIDASGWNSATVRQTLGEPGWFEALMSGGSPGQPPPKPGGDLAPPPNGAPGTGTVLVTLDKGSLEALRA